MGAPISFSLASEVCGTIWLDTTLFAHKLVWFVYLPTQHEHLVLPLCDQGVHDGTADLASSSSDSNDGHGGYFGRGLVSGGFDIERC